MEYYTHKNRKKKHHNDADTIAAAIPHFSPPLTVSARSLASLAALTGPLPGWHAALLRPQFARFAVLHRCRWVQRITATLCCRHYKGRGCNTLCIAYLMHARWWLRLCVLKDQCCCCYCCCCLLLLLLLLLSVTQAVTLQTAGELKLMAAAVIATVYDADSNDM